jgi:hypothetical protein
MSAYDAVDDEAESKAGHYLTDCRLLEHKARCIGSARLAQEAEGSSSSLVKTHDWISERPPRGGFNANPGIAVLSKGLTSFAQVRRRRAH